MLQLAEAIDKEFELGNLNNISPDLKAFANTQLENPRSPIIGFIDENEDFFRKFLLKAKDMSDLRRKIRSEFKAPQDFIQDISAGKHEHIDLIEIRGRERVYSDTRDKIQNIIEHDKQMDDFIYTGAIIACDERGLEICYFSTLDEDEFGEENRDKLKDVDNRVEVFIPNEHYDSE